jgi:hypothetical protein
VIGILPSSLACIPFAESQFVYKIVLTLTLTNYAEPIPLQARPLLLMPQGTATPSVGASNTLMFIANYGL